MLRKIMMAALLVTTASLLAPQVAEAGGGFGGGGWGHGGWGHGWHGGFWPGVAIGAGIAGAGYDDGAYGAQCYLVRQRVMTQWGWRVRRAQVCE